ncbi:MAG: EAL domain-containing protein [Planktomarina sp.]
MNKATHSGFQHGPGQINTSDPLSYAVSIRDLDTIKMVRSALIEGRTALAYQPVVKAADPSQVAFFEGLIRLKDPSGRYIPAHEFINAIEDTELGRELDCVSLDLGLRALAAEPKLRLSINMSARSIGYKKWRILLEQALDLQPLLAKRLILEVTEASAMTMPELVIDFMQDMQGRGVSFALDDFGSGQTSFRYLRDFFFDILKIDGQFTKDLANNADNQVLVQALISISAHFEMFIVAEAVESANDAKLLTDLGIDCMQGYHFGAPTISPPWVRKAKTADAGS